jgi:hypothetical protein
LTRLGKLHQAGKSDVRTGRREPLDLSPCCRYYPTALRAKRGRFAGIEVPIVRQSAQSLLWLVLLAFLPGCALFGGASANDSPRRVYDRREWEEAHPGTAELQVAPLPVEVPRPPGAERLPQGPPIAIPSVDPNTMGVDAPGPAKRSPGSGLVTIEPLFDPTGVQKTAAQGPPSPSLDKGNDLAPLTQAIQYMLDGQHQQAIIALRAYDEETQEFYLSILPLMTILAKTPISKLPPEQLARANDLLLSLRETLRPRSELLVNRMQYCKEIKGFGEYEPLPDNHAFLNATKEHPGELVQIYVELKNFASVRGKDGMYLTKLACSLELHDANDKRVGPPLRFDDKETTYRRSACLNDYHGNFSFYVPPIPAGTYKLILQIADLTIPNERRVTRKSLDFRVTPVANQTTLRGE